jgi:hypothetical protein
MCQRSYQIFFLMGLIADGKSREGRAASKSPLNTFGYFPSTSQQEVSADNIQYSAVGNFFQKTEGT